MLQLFSLFCYCRLFLNLKKEVSAGDLGFTPCASFTNVIGLLSASSWLCEEIDSSNLSVEISVLLNVSLGCWGS